MGFPDDYSTDYSAAIGLFVCNAATARLLLRVNQWHSLSTPHAQTADHPMPDLDNIEYDPEAGLFKWIVTTWRHKQGWFKGKLHNKGYHIIYIGGEQWTAHRVAWHKMTNGPPSKLIDHANGDPSDNRWCNLRLATISENTQNQALMSTNTSGFKGVKRQPTGRYRAVIVASGKFIHIGMFSTAEAAARAYDTAARFWHGDFARTNADLGLL